MAHAYTPGLRVTRRATIRKRRLLPIRGEVVVGVGDAVRRDQPVARTELPGEVATVNLVNRLGVTPGEVASLMLKQAGDSTDEGEAIAETRPLIKWFRRRVASPIAGTVESVSSVTGQVILRRPPRPVQVTAFVDGRVTEVIPEEGVVVEANGAYIQGIFGVGGECWGALELIGDAPGVALEPDRIGDDCRGRILVGGGRVGLPAIRRAREVGAAGIIGSGIHDQDLRQLLGYDLGVAITGTEAIGLTVIVTEGFGDIGMARKTFDILKANDGRDASISGATQIRGGVQRPEIVIPSEVDGGDDEVSRRGGGLEVGSLLRAIRSPYFGRIGRVSALPEALETVESEARVRVVEVAFEDGEQATVPRANVELIEE